MDRRSVIKHAGIAGVLAAGAAPAVHAQAAIRWRLTSSLPQGAGHHLRRRRSVLQAGQCEMSGGKFQISVHPSGELVGGFGVRSMPYRTARSRWRTPRPTTSSARTRPLRWAALIPFGLNSRQMTAWMYEGNGMKLMREFYANYNIINFPGGNTGAQMGGWWRKEIKSVADLKGQKFRTGGFSGKVIFERIGGVPQNIPGGEIYQALEKGTIDAAEWVGPYDDEKLGFNKVAPFYAYPGYWEGGPQLDLLHQHKAYNGLSAEYKAIVETAASFAHAEMQARYDARNPAALKRLVAGGTKLFRFPKDVLDTWRSRSRWTVQRAVGQEPAWKKIYDDYALPPRPEPLVPLHRSWLRRLHAAATPVIGYPALNRAGAVFLCSPAQ
jgi:TRAP-type mannitol/chloroaromatic compound transport system substrate-binding protein